MKPISLLRRILLTTTRRTAAGEVAAIERGALQGVAWLVLRYGLGFLVNVAGTVIVARTLGPERWGFYALSSFVLTALALLSQGVWGYLVSAQRELTAEDIDSGFLLQRLLGASALLGTVVVVGPAAGSYFDDSTVTIFMAGAGIGGYFYCWRYAILALAERRMAYRLVVEAELLDILTFNVCGVAGSLLGEPVVGVSVGNAARGVVSALYARWRTGVRAAWRWHGRTMRRVAPFAGRYLVFVTLQSLPFHGGPVLVGLLAGAVNLGYVQMAYRILDYPRVLVTLGFRVGTSAYSKLPPESAELWQMVRTSLEITYIIVAPAVALLAGASPWWVPMVYGPAWAPISDIMVLLAAPFMVTAGYVVLTTALSATGAVRAAAAVQGVHNLLFWTAALLMVPRLGRFGLPAAEWVALASGALLLREYRRHCGNLELRGVLVKLLAAVAVMATVWASSRMGWSP